MVRMANRWNWDLADFNHFVIQAPVFPQPLLDVLSPFEIAVVQRIWKSDFTDGQWQRGTFDFIGAEGPSGTQYGSPRQRADGPPAQTGEISYSRQWQGSSADHDMPSYSRPVRAPRPAREYD